MEMRITNNLYLLGRMFFVNVSKVASLGMLNIFFFFSEFQLKHRLCRIFDSDINLPFIFHLNLSFCALSQIDIRHQYHILFKDIAIVLHHLVQKPELF